MIQLEDPRKREFIHDKKKAQEAKKEREQQIRRNHKAKLNAIKKRTPKKISQRKVSKHISSSKSISPAQFSLKLLL